MAVGADMQLPKSQPSALRFQPRPVMRPPSISESKVQSAANNQLEAGSGAREMARQSLDNTKGVSRGRGLQYASDIAQADAGIKARGAAAATEMGAAASNADAAFSYETAMRDANSSRGLLDGLRNAAAQEQLNRRGLQQQMSEAARRGQFGLDQMQLDYTPLLASLFR